MRGAFVKDLLTFAGDARLMTQRMLPSSNIGPMLGIGILGAFLSALTIWLTGGPALAVIAGYVFGGMIYTVLGAVWLARVQLHPSN